MTSKRLATLGMPIPPDLLATVYQVTRGHPFYIYATTMRALEMVSLLHKPLDSQTAQEAFVLETLGVNGRIYNLCRYVVEQSLRHTRGETMPQAILQALAQEMAGLSLTQLARRLKRPSGAIRQLLNWLIEVDLLTQQEDKTYVFRDPVLQVWVAYYYGGLELTGMPRQKVLDQLVAEMLEKYQRVASELGLAKESQVRELLQRFAGQEVDGALLGLAGRVHLPTFNRVAPHRSADGQVEIDALAEGDERWVVEIKWRNRLAGLKEIQELTQTAQAMAARPWFISRAGFTPEATTYAQQAGVRCSAREQIEALAKIVSPTPLT